MEDWRSVPSKTVNRFTGRILWGLLTGLAIVTISGFGSVAFAEDTVPSGLTPVQQLGKRLFFDTRLSTPCGMSCSTCHEPTAAFTDPRGSSPVLTVAAEASQDSCGETLNVWSLGLPVSAGVLPGRYGSRNGQSAAYAAFCPPLHFDPTIRPGVMEGMYVGGFFWDGRVDTLEGQADEPPLNPLEMHNPDKQAIAVKLQMNYAAEFTELFGPGALDDPETACSFMTQAMAEYERSSEVCRFDSKYDQYVENPEAVPLTDSELRGLALFTGKAKCMNCHSLDTTLAGKALFTNFGHQNIGVPKNPMNPYYYLPKTLNPDGADFVDLGLGGVLNDPKENGKFKIPSLRNVAVTAPYMHNGFFKTLREIVMFDNTRDVSASWPPPEVAENVHRHMPPMDGTFGRLGLVDDEIDDIVAFLTTLTDGYVPEGGSQTQ